MARQQKLSFAKDFAREVIPVPVAEEMSESFLAYSLSVITARASPDVRDGLKPVQRRILYSMLGMGLRPATPHRKCARVVGDTMGILEVLMIPQPQPVTQSVALLRLRWKWFVRLRKRPLIFDQHMMVRARSHCIYLAYFQICW